MSDVGAATEAKLRNAMERLLNGTAINSDGRLTKSNLAKEAGVSRATMHRANALLVEWDERATTRAPEARNFAGSKSSSPTRKPRHGGCATKYGSLKGGSVLR